MTPNTDAALQVMVSTHTRLDCAAALSMIPGEVALDKVCGTVSPRCHQCLSVPHSSFLVSAQQPCDPPSSQIMPFLQLVLSSTTHTRRTNQVVRHLLEAEHMTAKFEVSGRGCCISSGGCRLSFASCDKAMPSRDLGVVVFSLFPGPTVVHARVQPADHDRPEHRVPPLPQAPGKRRVRPLSQRRCRPLHVSRRRCQRCRLQLTTRR